MNHADLTEMTPEFGSKVGIGAGLDAAGASHDRVAVLE